MDIPLRTLKRKVYFSTGICLVLWILIFLNIIFLLGGITFHNGFCVLNTRMDLVHYKNLQSRLKFGVEILGWQSVRITSRYGYALEGTFIPSPTPSNKTIILLHGISATQNMGLHFAELYLSNGYNLLIYDSRAHGLSGGSCVSWGYYEKYDLDQWIDWLLEKNPQSTIGVHGVSMGAATALMHSALNESTKRVKFYVADSAYSDLTKLITLKLNNLTGLNSSLWINILVKYASLAAYCQSNFLYEEVSPIKYVAQVTTPILYLHGDADTLIPIEMAQSLCTATKGYRSLHIFPNTKHGMAIIERNLEYKDTIQKFLSTVDGG